MLLIVDVKGLAFRTAWGSSDTRTVGDRDLTPTYGFLKSLAAVYRRIPHIKKVVFCADPPHPTYPHRREIFPEYKVKAPGKPGGKAYEDKAKARVELVHSNLPVIKQAATMMQCLWFEDPDFEADDLVAWTVGHMPDKVKVILSNDRDFFQLIQPGVEQLFSKNKKYTSLTADTFSQAVLPIMLGDAKGSKPGMMPTPFPQRWFLPWKCFVGDNSDGNPGVPKVGPKTAYKMILDHKDAADSIHPVPLLNGWIRSQYEREGGPTATAQRIHGSYQDVVSILERNYRLMNLDPTRSVPSRNGQHGQHNPQAMFNFLQSLQMPSLTQDSDFFNFLGALQ